MSLPTQSRGKISFNTKLVLKNFTLGNVVVGFLVVIPALAFARFLLSDILNTPFLYQDFYILGGIAWGVRNLSTGVVNHYLDKHGININLNDLMSYLGKSDKMTLNGLKQNDTFKSDTIFSKNEMKSNVLSAKSDTGEEQPQFQPQPQPQPQPLSQPEPEPQQYLVNFFPGVDSCSTRGTTPDLEPRHEHGPNPSQEPSYQ